MCSLVSRDVGFVLEGQSDIVETIKQAVTRELVDGKARGKALAIINNAVFKINRELI